jgi:tetraacyldisaccharide 4'-kinase
MAITKGFMKNNLRSKNLLWPSQGKIETFLFHVWSKRNLLSDILLPFSWIYALVQRSVKSKQSDRKIKVDVPVIAVGNLTVGGTGKTPFCIALGLALQAQGLRPAYVVRAFKAKAKEPTKVHSQSLAAEVGDEALLLWQRTGLPVFSGRYKWQAAKKAAQEAIDVIIVDDGLQHYRLHHDLAILLIDSQYGFGNGRLLPAGPLRELPQDVKMDMQVAVGAKNNQAHFTMQVKPAFFYALHEPQRKISFCELKDKKILAVAGIARPERFFDTLSDLGLSFAKRIFPDHHTFNPNELAFDGVIVMTEKDAVKCQHFDLKNIWVLAMDVMIEENLTAVILERLYGSKTLGLARMPSMQRPFALR